MLIHKSKKLKTAWACLTEKILYNKINCLDTKHEQKDTVATYKQFLDFGCSVCYYRHTGQ